MNEDKTSDDEADWRHKIDDVRSLLDRLKEERQAELNRQNESVLVESRSHIQPQPPPVYPKKWKKEHENRDVIHKHMENKHGLFISEIHEKAELISRTARKEPKRVLHAIDVSNDKEDKEKEELLAKIRATPTSPMKQVTVTLPITVVHPPQDEEKTEIEPVHHEVSEVEIAPKIDLNTEPEVTFILNVGVQKSKAALGKCGFLKGRRKPDAVQRRSRVLSSASSDGMDIDVVEEEEEEEEEKIEHEEKNRNEIEVFVPGLSSPPVSPSRTRYEDRRLRGKSMPVGGVAMPVLSEIILQKPNLRTNRNNIESSNLPKRQSAAELVASATHRKQQQAAKEDKMDSLNTSAEKPSWMVEMEARRKRRENALKLTQQREENAPPVPPKPVHYNDDVDSAPQSPRYRTITVTSSAFERHKTPSPPHSPRRRISSDGDGKENGHPMHVQMSSTVVASPVIEQNIEIEQKSPSQDENLPQWKKDLLQKKKNASTKLLAVNGFANTQQAPTVSHGIVVLPQWKQDLMERHRQSREQTAVVKTDDIPAWKKQLNEKRKSKTHTVMKDTKSEPGLSEFDRKMAERQKLADRIDTDSVIQASLVSEEIIKDEEKSVPTFMKEFEKGKRRIVTVSSFVKKPETDNEPEFFKMRRNIRTATKYQT